jgi:hypothetical protein
MQDTGRLQIRVFPRIHAAPAAPKAVASPPTQTTVSAARKRLHRRCQGKIQGAPVRKNLRSEDAFGGNLYRDAIINTCRKICSLKIG